MLNISKFMVNLDVMVELPREFVPIVFQIVDSNLVEFLEKLNTVLRNRHI